MKRYTIRRQDFFEALGKGELKPDVQILHAGSIWMDVVLSPDERLNYSFPITQP